jgi:hypothetical protein
LICHRCCYVFGKRFPVMLMINRSAGDIWSDDKAGASVAPPPLYFNFPRDDKDRPLQLHTAQCLSLSAASSRDCKLKNTTQMPILVTKASAYIRVRSGPPSNRDGQSVDLVGVVMCGNRSITSMGG